MPTILVVDDEAIFRDLISSVLRSNGFKVFTASSGDTALAICRSTPPDLILLDLAMPGVDGHGFMKAWSAECPQRLTPIIVLTATSERNAVIQAARLGVREFMLKSHFSLKTLLARIKARLETPAAVTVGEALAGAGDIAHVAAAPGLPPQPDAAVHVAVRDEAACVEPDDANLPAALRAVKPVISRTEMQERLDTCGQLKAMSPTVARILALCRSESCSIEQITAALKQDDALTLTMLKIANSTMYARGEPVESIQQAVARIGIAQARQIVANVGIVDSFSKGRLTNRLNAALLWEHSIACGLTCAQIARGLDAPPQDIDSAFTLGLLHDVGRLVYTDVLGDTYTQVLNVAEQLQLPLEQVESRMLLINHADAMERILHAWHLPRHLVDPIVFHHMSAADIRRASPRMLRMSCMLALADRLTHAMLIGDSGNPTLYPTAEFVQTLDLPPRVVEQIESTVPDETCDLKLTMMAQADRIGWQPSGDQPNHRLAPSVRPVFVGCDPATDPFRIACARWNGPRHDEPANIALVHINHARERVTVGNRLREVESNRALAGLPLAVLSPNGQLRLEESVVAGRRAVHLPSTITLPRLIAAICETAGVAAENEMPLVA